GNTQLPEPPHRGRPGRGRPGAVLLDCRAIFRLTGCGGVARRLPEDDALGERISGAPVGAVETPDDLPACEEAGQRRLAAAGDADAPVKEVRPGQDAGGTVFEVEVDA